MEQAFFTSMFIGFFASNVNIFGCFLKLSLWTKEGNIASNLKKLYIIMYGNHTVHCTLLCMVLSRRQSFESKCSCF